MPLQLRVRACFALLCLLDSIVALVKFKPCQPIAPMTRMWPSVAFTFLFPCSADLVLTAAVRLGYRMSTSRWLAPRFYH